MTETGVDPGATDDRACARDALERVCSGGELDAAARFYSDEFVDHVNALEYRGLDGVRKSVALYRLVFTDLQIRVLDQVAEGDRVVSRWTAEGTNRSRRLAISGITISRFADGKIVEDWSASNDLDLLRRLGLRRTLLLGLDWLRARRRSIA
jgi:predicted ester cyclase